MEVVVISSSSGALARVQIQWPIILAAVVILGSIAAGLVTLGYRTGTHSTAELILADDSAESTSFWQKEIVGNRKFLSTLRNEFDADLSVLSSKVGTLQAHIARLDALAERLVGVANLDLDEFRLSESPAVGGPSSAATETPHWHNLLLNLESLGGEIALQEDRLDALNSLLMDRKLQEDMYPAGHPVKEGWISSRFGYRMHPVSGSKEFHGGIDFAGRPGLDIHAVGGGIVTWSGSRWGYGNLVEINHGNGYVTRYAHNKKNLVKIGEKVAKDQTVALLGSTGRSTGPHVHFEVIKDGKVVDPRDFLGRRDSE